MASPPGLLEPPVSGDDDGQGADEPGPRSSQLLLPLLPLHTSSGLAGCCLSLAVPSRYGLHPLYRHGLEPPPKDLRPRWVCTGTTFRIHGHQPQEWSPNLVELRDIPRLLQSSSFPSFFPSLFETIIGLLGAGELCITSREEFPERFSCCIPFCKEPIRGSWLEGGLACAFLSLADFFLNIVPESKATKHLFPHSSVSGMAVEQWREGAPRHGERASSRKACWYSSVIAYFCPGWPSPPWTWCPH